MTTTSDRRVQKLQAYVTTGLESLPPENDAIRDTLTEVQALLTGALGRTFYEIHFTSEGFRTLGVYRLFYKAALQRIRAVEARYDADVRDWCENGDGRPRTSGGLGHRYPECIHGSSLWTDYDNICPGCEDGSTAVELAIGEARTRWLTFVQFFEWMTDSPAALPDRIRKEIADFSVTLFPKPIGY